MKPKLTAAATAAVLATALVLAGCGQTPADEAAPAEAAVAATDAAAPAAAVAPATAPAGAATALPAAPGAPAFAVVYPGSAIGGPATVAHGPDGPGGILSFTTEATPEAVVAFYRQRAEAAGLSSVMAMNQGDARAYGAVAPDRREKLHVVATPVDGGPTNVQLDWSTGG